MQRDLDQPLALIIDPYSSLLPPQWQKPHDNKEEVWRSLSSYFCAHTSGFRFSAFSPYEILSIRRLPTSKPTPSNLGAEAISSVCKRGIHARRTKRVKRDKVLV